MNRLLGLLPPIKRIRGNRLYAADGRRFLDLWLDDGRGILGEHERAVRTQAANAADKGLVRPYPGLYDARLIKALRETWPGFGTVKVFASDGSAMEAAARVLGSAPRLSDPAQPPHGHPPSEPGAARPAQPPHGHPPSEPGAARFFLARPFCPLPAGAELILPRLPCPRPWAASCLMARDGSAAAKALAREPGDIIPAQWLVASARGLHGLQAATRDGYGESHWARFDRRLGRCFDRRGPYLFARVGASDYEAFFKAALDGGALVSPDPEAPSIVPPDFDDGELLKLVRALEHFSAS